VLAGAEADPSLEDAYRIARQLIGEPPAAEEAARWIAAVRVRGARLTTPRELRLWTITMRHPWLLGFADAGLALIDPYSPFRHRLLLMLAILEASPEHHRCFLPAPYSRLALLGVAVLGAWAGLRAVTGLLWVRSYGLLWR